MTSTAMTRSTGHAPRTEDEEETAGGMTASTSTAFADEDNEKAAAAVKLQAVVKGYRERKAFKDIDTYVSAACDEEEQEQEEEEEDEDEDEARRRSSLSARELRNDNLEDRASLEMSRSFSACDLQQVKQVKNSLSFSLSLFLSLSLFFSFALEAVANTAVTTNNANDITNRDSEQ